MEKTNITEVYTKIKEIRKALKVKQTARDTAIKTAVEAFRKERAEVKKTVADLLASVKKIRAEKKTEREAAKKTKAEVKKTKSEKKVAKTVVEKTSVKTVVPEVGTGK